MQCCILASDFAQVLVAWQGVASAVMRACDSVRGGLSGPGNGVLQPRFRFDTSTRARKPIHFDVGMSCLVADANVLVGV